MSLFKRLKNKKLKVLQSTFLLLLLPFSLWAQDVVQTEHARVKLYLDHSQVKAKETKNIMAAFEFELKPEWHVYWKNPGDSGLAPKLQVLSPQNMVAGEILYPTPSKIKIGELANYGYEDKVTLLVPLSLENLSGGEVDISLRLDWLICKEECVPEEGIFTKKLKFGATDESVNSELFSRAKNLITIQTPAHAEYEIQNNILNLYVPIHKNHNELHALEFFPDQALIVKAATDQNVEKKGSKQILHIQLDEQFDGRLKELHGLLRVEDKSTGELKSYRLIAQTKKDFSLFIYLVFAFIGGVILNLMPCVFPVLSIKVLNFVQQSGEDKKALRLHGWVFTLGVLISFLVLASLLLILRSAGESVGWGFQLQSPLFVSFLIILFYLMSLNFLGWFDLNFSGPNILYKVKKPGLSSSFFSGVVAVLIASPCTAPFMGTAIGASLVLGYLETLLIFLFLGFGLAFPYLVLSYWTALLKRLPRPGAWMELLKQALAFPLLVTVIWLLSVLSKQVEVAAIITLLLFLVGLTFVIWTIKMPRLKVKIFLVSLSILLCAVIGYGAWQSLQLTYGTLEKTTSQRVRWNSFSKTFLDQSLGEGKRVFIDYTASWCITCQANKRFVLSTDKVEELFLKENIVLIRADWTNRNAEITESLRSFGRNSVPLYVYYDENKKVHILPELLTTNMIENLFSTSKQ